MDCNDDELVALLGRCALRDQKALERLFERMGGYLHAVAYRMVRSETLSQEVLQDAFVQIWQNAARYRPDIARPGTWMTSIVRYRALDQLARERKHQDRRAGSDDHRDPLAELAGTDSPEEDAARWQVQRFLADCFERLSQRIREAVALAYLEGWSREELAHRFATNTNTVKSWLHRGANRLRQCLEARINP